MEQGFQFARDFGVHASRGKIAEISLHSFYLVNDFVGCNQYFGEVEKPEGNREPSYHPAFRPRRSVAGFRSKSLRKTPPFFGLRLSVQDLHVPQQNQDSSTLPAE